MESRVDAAHVQVALESQHSVLHTSLAVTFSLQHTASFEPFQQSRVLEKLTDYKAPFAAMASVDSLEECKSCRCLKMDSF